MSFIQRFLLGNRVEDDLQVGLFLKNDGTVWLRNPDGSETQVAGGGGGGGEQWNVVEISSPGTPTYTGTANDLVLASDNSGGITVNLPESPPSGSQVGVIVAVPPDEHISITTTDGSTINAASSLNIFLHFAAVVVTFDGANWEILSQTLVASGPVGGDLSGSLPDPVVESIQGAAFNVVGGAAGDVLTQNDDGSYSPAPVAPALPAGWTADSSDPANVDTHGGTLTAGGITAGPSAFTSDGSEEPAVSAVNLPGQSAPVARFGLGGLQANGDIIFDSSGEVFCRAITVGVAGNSLTVELIDPGAPDVGLSVAQVGSATQVTLATDGGSAITSMASDIIAAIDAALGLSVTADSPASPDGLADAGTIVLAGGLDAQDAWAIMPEGWELLVGTPDANDSYPSAGDHIQWFHANSGEAAIRFVHKDVDGTATDGRVATMTTDSAAFLGVSKPDLPTSPTAAEIAAVLDSLGLVNLT